MKGSKAKYARQKNGTPTLAAGSHVLLPLKAAGSREGEVIPESTVCLRAKVFNMYSISPGFGLG